MNEEISVKLTHQYSLNLGLTHSCNLACRTCRDERITTQAHMSTEDFQTLLDYMQQFYNVAIGCSGETFYSDIYMQLLQTNLHKGYTNSITIFTNGTLMNETNWNKLHPENKKIVKDIKISIDAACEETYKQIRNEHLWSTLCNNIDFIRSVKNDDCTLSTTFTISKFNYKEIDAFVEFALHKGFTKILFNFARPKLMQEHDTNAAYFVLDTQTKTAIKEHVFDLSKQYTNFDNNIHIGLS